MATPPSGASVVCAGVVHVYRAFGTDTAALRGVDLTVPPGQQIALLGPSGSGKSTLLTLLAGIRQPSAGEIRVDDRDISRLAERDLRRYRAHTVGTLLQGAAENLLGFASPDENVRYARQAVPRRHRGQQSVAPLLRAVGLPDSAYRIPVRRLPPSQQQATAVAVAMTNSPRLLVADEPTSQLDEATRDTLLDALLAVVAQNGTTLIIVTHDSEVAYRMQRTLHLRDGRVGAEEHERERFAVLGADRSVQLPDHLVAEWTTGTRVRVTAVTSDELRLTRIPEP
jgi:putative ABC transport system ATP-binding protein